MANSDDEFVYNLVFGFDQTEEIPIPDTFIDVNKIVRFPDFFRINLIHCRERH